MKDHWLFWENFGDVVGKYFCQPFTSIKALAIVTIAATKTYFRLISLLNVGSEWRKINFTFIMES